MYLPLVEYLPSHVDSRPPTVQPSAGNSFLFDLKLQWADRLLLRIWGVRMQPV